MVGLVGKCPLFSIPNVDGYDFRCPPVPKGKKHDYRLKAYLLSKRAQGPVSGASVGRKVNDAAA